jgi:AsmA protein
VCRVTGNPVMKKALKITGIVVGILVLLVIVLALTLPFLINPNRFKDDIAAAVKDKTGRELVIQGDIKLSMFPWLGLQIGPMELSNAQGFGGAPFAAINETDVHVHFWPLLHREVQVGEVKLEGLTLDLELDPEGHNNWQDISEHLAHNAAKTPVGEGGSARPGLSFESLSVSDSQVRWTNAEKHQQYTVSDFTLTTGAFSPGVPVNVESAFDFTGTNPAVQGHVDFRASATADLAHRTYSSDGAKLDLQAKGDAVPGGQLDTSLQWQHAALNLDNDAAALNGFSADLYGMQVKLDAQGKDVVKQPSYTGTLKIDRFSPRDTLKALGHATLATTRDAAALGAATASFSFVTTPTSASLSAVDLTLDDTHVTGKAEIKDFKTEALGFDLNADKLDLDRYLPPPQPGTPDRPREAVDVDKVGIPLRTLRGLNLDGELHTDTLTLLGAKVTDFDLGVSAHGGLVHVTSLKAALYGGSLEGELQVDAQDLTSDSPVVNESLKLKGVQLAGLGRALADSDRVTGTLDLDTTGKALGRTVGELRHTLNGRLSYSLHNGALGGVNVWDAVQRAYADAHHQAAPPPVAQQTPYTTLRGSAVISRGVVNDRSFTATLPYLALAGSGRLDLAELTLDYALTGRVTGLPRSGAQDLSGLKGLSFPLHVGGTLFNLSVHPELGKK